MLGVFQLTARSHHRIDVLRALVQSNHLVLEGVHAIFVRVPLGLQLGELVATLLEALHLFGPVTVDGGVLLLDALPIVRIRLPLNRLGAFVQRVKLVALGLAGRMEIREPNKRNGLG